MTQTKLNHYALLLLGVAIQVSVVAGGLYYMHATSPCEGTCNPMVGYTNRVMQTRYLDDLNRTR